MFSLLGFFTYSCWIVVSAQKILCEREAAQKWLIFQIENKMLKAISKALHDAIRESLNTRWNTRVSLVFSGWKFQAPSDHKRHHWWVWSQMCFVAPAPNSDVTGVCSEVRLNYSENTLIFHLKKYIRISLNPCCQWMLWPCIQYNV